VERAVVDKDVRIGPGARVGDSGDDPGGITVVGKGAEIPEGSVVAPGRVVPMGVQIAEEGGTW
jgi:UDP-3-O-[3-hydroxymyristoyl] glucosamine N-acyltransferase